jgi:hypothetical protein
MNNELNGQLNIIEHHSSLGDIKGLQYYKKLEMRK